MSKVSVYITTCNYSHFVEQAIRSVINQSLRDWELIVINDGSTDNTEEILKQFEGHHQIRIVHQKNQGLLQSCINAISMAKGEYIIRLDGDDYFEENALLVLSKTLDNNAEIGLVYPDYYVIDRRGEVVSIERREKIGDDVQIFDLPAHGAGTMFRKKIYEELGGYNATLECQDGYDLWLKFIHNFRVCNVNLPLFYYRRHGSNLTNNTEKILENRRRIKREFVEKKFGERMPKVLGIIPARGESNVYPKLALKTLAGRPLISYTIEEAQKTKNLSKIVVTSDDEEILNYSKKYHDVILIRRPTDLSKSNSPIEPTIQFVINEMAKQQFAPDLICILYTNSPLRKEKHITEAIDTLLIFDTDSVISVYEDRGCYYQHRENGLVPLFKKRMLRLEKEVLYQENGAIYLSKSSCLTSYGYFGSKIGHILMSYEESFQIDAEFQFWLIEQMLLKNRSKLRY